MSFIGELLTISLRQTIAEWPRHHGFSCLVSLRHQHHRDGLKVKQLPATENFYKVKPHQLRLSQMSSPYASPNSSLSLKFHISWLYMNVLSLLSFGKRWFSFFFFFFPALLSIFWYRLIHVIYNGLIFICLYPVCLFLQLFILSTRWRHMTIGYPALTNLFCI